MSDELNENGAAVNSGERKGRRVPGLPPKARRMFKIIATVAVAAIAAYYAMILASPTDITVGPLRVGFQLSPSVRGVSEVDLPPAGTIAADTHYSPVAARFLLKEIAVDDIDELSNPESPARNTLENWREPVYSQVGFLLLKISAAAVLAGAIVAGLLRRRLRWVLAGGATGLVVAAAVVGSLYGSYDVSAFSEPRYSGSLTRAPEVIAFSELALANLDEYGDRIYEIADSLYRTVSELHQLPPDFPEEETIRVVHVSDLHNSAGGASLVGRVADLYDADLVIDTGDTSELGLAYEIRYPRSYLPFDAPYIWIAGNHDTREYASAMEALPGVIVLDDSFTEVEGMTIGGFFDPAVDSQSPDMLSDAKVAEEAENVAGIVDRQNPRPFIVAVHDPRMGALLAGKVPVVLNGHTHNESIAVREGTVFLDAGTTGGGGYRSFEDERESPGSLQVLYVQRGSLRLLAVDSISIYGFSQEFNIRRRTFSPGEGRLPGMEAALPAATSAL